MADPYSNFVSKRKIEKGKKEKKLYLKQERERVLSEAKNNFEKSKREKERKRKSGEDEWMLPSLSDKLEGSPSSKKKKKSKKKKSKHRKDKSSREPEGVSSSESASEEEVWVTRGEVDVGAREGWMVLPGTQKQSQPDSSLDKQEDKGFLGSILERSSARVKEIKKKPKLTPEQLSCLTEPGQHSRELNPYWRDGGLGLPSDCQPVAEQQKVGDGGRSWLLRSYKRAKEQAEKENRLFRSVVEERWGSMENLYSLLEQAGIDPDNPDSALAELAPYPAKGLRREIPHSTSSHSTFSTREDRYRDISGKGKGSSKFTRPGEDKSGEKTISSTHFAGLGSSRPQPDTSQQWKKLSHRHDDHHHSDVDKVSSGSRQPSSRRQLPSENETNNTDVRPKDRLIQCETVSGSGQVQATPLYTPPSEPITDTQLNSLSAKIIKAELVGQSEKASQLKEELERLRKLKEEQGREATHPPRGEVERETVVLTKSDKKGNVWPASKPYSGGRGPGRVRKGRRKDYFADDEDSSIQDLIRQERMATAEDTHAMIARMASRFVPTSQSGEEVVDDLTENKSSRTYDYDRHLAKESQRNILQSKKMAECVQNCVYCFGGNQFKKHLVISIGEKVYLSLPSHQSLTEGHALIVPLHHTPCTTALDEDVWAELDTFRKTLTRMFASRGKDVVFMETYTANKLHSHMYWDCIPLDPELGDEAPIYFKKAILESEEEWSINKKLVDTKKKGIRRSLPRGLPYFVVEFGMSGGFGHVVEDRSQFPHYFGREVVGGMLDVDTRLWRKPHQEQFERQKEKVIQFASWWKDFDCTKS